MVKVKSSTKPKGQAAQYLTRTRAIRKLQLSLPTFRRLCILKGIYPRYPSSIKKIQSASGKNGAHRGQTFYYTKDIQYLMHDPLVRTMRQLKVYKRKLKKLAGREEWERIEHLEKPVVQLSHVLKERFPTFQDALKDMDDALCHLFLFNALPVNNPANPNDTTNHKVSEDLFPRNVMCKVHTLCSAWQELIVDCGFLKKAFLSIKGVYYQAIFPGQGTVTPSDAEGASPQNANGNGVPITWLVPYPFQQDLSVPISSYAQTSAGAQQMAVDARVMASFLEFYVAMSEAVLNKLYMDRGLKLNLIAASKEADGEEVEEEDTEETAVPTEGDAAGTEKKLTRNQRKKMMRQLRTLPSKLNELAQSQEQQEDKPTESEETIDDQQDTVETVSASVQPTGLFQGVHFFISREVPVSIFGFILRSMGAQVSYSPTAGPTPNLPESSKLIKYQLMDRPLSDQYIAADSQRVYVQPQWVVDCLNRNQILDPVLYAPGKKLPPHWSPFYEVPVYEEEEGGEQAVTEGSAMETESKQNDTEVIDEGAEQLKQNPEKQKKQKESEQKMEAKELRDMRIMMLSNKKRKLLQKVDKLRGHQQAEHDKLRAKRQLTKSKK